MKAFISHPVSITGWLAIAKTICSETAGIERFQDQSTGDERKI
jgi:hypothetical protein